MKARIIIALVALLVSAPPASAQKRIKEVFEDVGKYAGVTQTSEQKSSSVDSAGITSESRIITLKVKKNHYTAVFDKLQQAFDDESSHASMYNTHTHDVDGNGENNSSRHPWSVWREGNSPILVGYMKNSCYLTAIFDDKKHPGYRTCYAAEWSDADDPDISIAQLTYVYGRKPEQQNYNLTINYDGKASWPEKKLNLLDYPVMPDNVKQSLKRLRNLPDSLFSIYSVPKDIPYDGDKNSCIGKALNSISRLSNRDWHRFFGLLTEKMIAHANDKGSTEDMVVAAGLVLDLCKNADPLDADERTISANRLTDVAQHYFDNDKHQYIYDLLMLGAKKLKKE